MLTGTTKINVNYDDIKVFNERLGYYLVQSNSKYGVINSNEELVIHMEYDKIGIDIADFPAAGLKNQYLLYDKLIPVCLNEKWGLFDIDGKKIAEVEYDTMGCVINEDMTERILDNALTVGETEVVIVSKDGLYGGVSSRGDLLLPLMFEYAYSVTSGGETSYFVVYNEKDYNATDYINRMKEILGYDEDEEETQNQEQTEQAEETENTENTENSEVEVNTVEIFNSSFEAYAGTHSKSTTVALINTVANSNSSHTDKVEVEYNGNIYVDNVSEISRGLDKESYTIKIEHNSETGIVNKIIIN